MTLLQTGDLGFAGICMYLCHLLYMIMTSVFMEQNELSVCPESYVPNMLRMRSS